MTDIKIIKKETLYKGYASLELYTVKTKLFRGGESKPYTRELFVRAEAVAVLPYDPIRDTVVLIEQFRIGAIHTGKPWLLELVAGVKDKKTESLEDLLQRELQEEAGLNALAILPIYGYFASPGASSEYTHIYCAKVDSTKAPSYAGLDQENEDIKVHVLKTEDVFSLLHTNKINNAASIIALQWLELNLEQVREKF